MPTPSVEPTRARLASPGSRKRPLKPPRLPSCSGCVQADGHVAIALNGKISGVDVDAGSRVGVAHRRAPPRARVNANRLSFTVARPLLSPRRNSMHVHVSHDAAASVATGALVVPVFAGSRARRRRRGGRPRPRRRDRRRPRRGRDQRQAERDVARPRQGRAVQARAGRRPGRARQAHRRSARQVRRHRRALPRQARRRAARLRAPGGARRRAGGVARRRRRAGRDDRHDDLPQRARPAGADNRGDDPGRRVPRRRGRGRRGRAAPRSARRSTPPG